MMMQRTANEYAACERQTLGFWEFRRALSDYGDQ